MFSAQCNSSALTVCVFLFTVRLRGMGTEPMGTILRFASVPPRKTGTLLLGSWWPCQCVLPTLYYIESRPNLELGAEDAAPSAGRPARAETLADWGLEPPDWSEGWWCTHPFTLDVCLLL